MIEGRGVIPDIELKPQTQDYVIAGLINSGVFFDFVVTTSGDIEGAIDVDSFEINDRQWESFLQYTVEQFNDQELQNTDRIFPYEPLSKKLIIDLEEAMTEDGFIDSSDLMSNLKTLIKPNLETDLKTHEDDIRQILGKEYVFHLENTSGVFKFELPKDLVTLEAISTLESDNYLQILSGNTNN